MFSKFSNKVILTLILCCFYTQLISQTRSLGLDRTIELALEGALDMYKVKRQYGSSYWHYRSFQEGVLPKVDLNLEPYTYNRSFVKRYDPENNIDVFRLQQNLFSFARVSVSQSILATGARVYVSSDFNRLVNYGDTRFDNYNITPVRVGLDQPIMAHNELKWNLKTSPLVFQKAKKDFVWDVLEIKIKTLDHFFKWALAKLKLEMAEENNESATRLYEIGLSRYNLGSIERDELLGLELEEFNSKINLNKAKLELREVVSNLGLYLGKVDLSGFSPDLPGIEDNLKIDLDEAVAFAQEHNPGFLNTAIRSVEAEKSLDKVLKENRFDLSVSASYGLNQQADNFIAAYNNFIDQQVIGVNFRIPILDWGERKGKIHMARMDKEVAEIEIEQAKNEVFREVDLTVSRFNLLEEQVQAALKSRDISRESYQITEKRFLSGKVDLLRLTSSRRDWQAKEEQFVLQLNEYWRIFYTVQKLTLFDFVKRKSLEEDFVGFFGDHH